VYVPVKVKKAKVKLSYKDKVLLALEEVKAEYRYQIACLIRECYYCQATPRNEANILILPCGHLLCCSVCLLNDTSNKIKRCALRRCNKVIRGTKEIYYG